MKQQDVHTRWVILAVGAAIQLLTGIPAAWGAFQPPVQQEYGLEERAVSFGLSVMIAAFGIGCVLGGFLQDKKGPRMAGLVGTGLLCAGFGMVGFVPQGSAWLLYLAFSVPVGLGCAFLYPAVMSCAQKWCQDKKGLATGVIGIAVGLSGGAYTLTVRWITGRWGIRVCFWVLAAVMLVVCGVGSLLLRNPPQSAQPEGDQGPDYTPGQMLRTRQYWLVAAVVALAAPSVLLFSPAIVEMGQQRGLSQDAAYWAIILGSAASAAGRLTMPALSDRIGRRATDLILFAALAGLSVWFAWAGGWWMLAVYGGLTFCYAAQGAILPSLCTDLFGLPHAGVNYGFLALGMTVGSLGVPLLARWFNNPAASHWVAAGASAAGFGLLLLLKPTQGKRI